MLLCCVVALSNLQMLLSWYMYLYTYTTRTRNPKRHLWCKNLHSTHPPRTPTTCTAFLPVSVSLTHICNFCTLIPAGFTQESQLHYMGRISASPASQTFLVLTNGGGPCRTGGSQDISLEGPPLLSLLLLPLGILWRQWQCHAMAHLTSCTKSSLTLALSAS